VELIIAFVSTAFCSLRAAAFWRFSHGESRARRSLVIIVVNSPTNALARSSMTNAFRRIVGSIDATRHHINYYVANKFFIMPLS